MQTYCYIMEYNSPLGCLTACSDGQSITGLWLAGQKYFGSTLSPDAVQKALPVFAQLGDWLDCYFSAKQPDFFPPLTTSGSAFRQAIWKILRSIPYGSLTTYGEIARQLEHSTGKAVSAQAVGAAVGHNPISILIPCHRVVGANGSLTGYAGGLDKKSWLLQLEGVNMERLFIPKHGTAL